MSGLALIDRFWADCRQSGSLLVLRLESSVLPVARQIRRAVLLFGMLAVLLAFGLSTNACPVKIGIDRDGAVFSDRMHGWYRTVQTTLASDLRTGCYNDANPSKITSVILEIAPHAPEQRIEQVYAILEKAGWSRNRIHVDTWTNDPEEPPWTPFPLCGRQ